MLTILRGFRYTALRICLRPVQVRLLASRSRVIDYSISNQSCLHLLNRFLDPEALILVGGRLRLADTPTTLSLRLFARLLLIRRFMES